MQTDDKGTGKYFDKKKVYVSLDWDKTEGINVVCRNYEIEKIGHGR